MLPLITLEAISYLDGRSVSGELYRPGFSPPTLFLNRLWNGEVVLYIDVYRLLQSRQFELYELSTICGYG